MEQYRQRARFLSGLRLMNSEILKFQIELRTLNVMDTCGHLRTPTDSVAGQVPLGPAPVAIFDDEIGKGG